MSAQFDANAAWHEKHITALENPISEFNARGGSDLADYTRHTEWFLQGHPDLFETMWPVIEAEMPPLELAEDPTTGQQLRLQRYNWPEDGNVGDEPVTISSMSFSVDLGMKPTNYQNYLEATALGTPVIFFDNPSYGKSDKLTTEQKEALKKQGDFGPIARPMLGISKELGVKKANFKGYSMGAEVAAAMAAHAHEYDIEAENLFIMEAPRVVAHPPLKLAKDFLGEANNVKFAWQHPMDPILRQAGQIKLGIPGGLVPYGRAMTRNGITRDVWTAMQTQPTMKLTIASANRSQISPNSANNRLYQSMRDHFPGRTRRIVIPGEGHAYGDSGRRYAELGRFVLGGPDTE